MKIYLDFIVFYIYYAFITSFKYLSKLIFVSFNELNLGVYEWMGKVIKGGILFFKEIINDKGLWEIC